MTSGLSKHLPRIQSWRHHGFAVVMLDNRGSANRGIQFEAFIKVIGAGSTSGNTDNHSAIKLL